MTPAPVKPEISMDDLDKLDIRVGAIRSVAEVAKSDKLRESGRNGRSRAGGRSLR